MLIRSLNNNVLHLLEHWQHQGARHWLRIRKWISLYCRIWWRVWPLIKTLDSVHARHCRYPRPLSILPNYLIFKDSYEIINPFIKLIEQPSRRSISIGKASYWNKWNHKQSGFLIITFISNRKWPRLTTIAIDLNLKNRHEVKSNRFGVFIDF